MAEYSIDADNNGNYRVTGDLTFETVPDIWEQHHAFSGGNTAVTVDLHDVTRADSAGLVLLVGWMRAAQEQGKQISFHNIPGQLLAIAKVSNLDRLLPLQA